jgi:tRNA(fMet)-specific endonuclease VapC
MIVVDTDYLSLMQRQQSVEAEEIFRLLNSCGVDVAMTIISAEEQMRGWLAVIRRHRDPHKQIPWYAKLQEMMEFFEGWRVLPWDEQAADEFRQLKSQKIRIGTMDLKIASIELSQGATLLSRNLADFEQVPALNVENWIA